VRLVFADDDESKREWLDLAAYVGGHVDVDVAEGLCGFGMNYEWLTW
jgi:hypothetical protein